MELVKRSTFKVLFYLKKNAPKKNGFVPVMIRITIDGELAQMSAKLDVSPQMWDTAAGKAIGKSAESQSINQKLDKILVMITNHYNTQMERESFTTAEKVKNAFLGIGVMDDSLLKVFAQHNEDFFKMVGKTRNYTTWNKYNVVYKHVANFMLEKYNRTDMAFRELTEDFIRDFDMYLRVDKNLMPNTVWMYMMPLCKMVGIAVHKGLIQVDPFENYEIKSVEVDRGYLTKEEVELLIKGKFAKKQYELVRDLFVFSVFTGLAYIDVKNLKESNLQTFFDDHLWIISRRQKTDVSSNVRLLEIPKKIIEKYRGMNPNGNIFPMPSNTTCNTQIRIVAALCGITKDVTYHLARHTFGTLMLSQGVPIESLSKMMGHTNISTTQIYAKITNDKISRDMDVLAMKLNGMETALIDCI